MKIFNSIIRCIFLLHIFLFCVFKVSANSYQVYVGQGFSLPSPTCPTSNGYINSYSFSCSSSDIEVDQNGYAKVTSYFTGAATIECFFQYMYLVNGNWRAATSSEYHQVSCKSNNISISAPKSSLNVGESMQMTYSFASSTYGISPQITWHSNSDAVFVNSKSGYVEAYNSGEATITASSNLGSNVASFTIRVQNIDPTEIQISSNLTAFVGENTSIPYKIYPSDAHTTLSWYCSNTNVATILDGNIYGKDEGLATVYCTTSNGLISNDCDVKVIYRPLNGLMLSNSEIRVPIGETCTLTCSPIPSNAKMPSVSWNSSDELIASVTQSGEIIGKKAGKTSIIVSSDNGYSAECEVTVPPNPERIALPNKISLYKGKSRKLSYVVEPIDASAQLSWQSSDANVANVNEYGIISAFYPGTATITVKTQNGKESSCSVDVPEPSFRLYIWNKAGEKMSVPLSEKPLMTEQEGTIYVSTSREEIQIVAADLRKLTIADDFANELPTTISIPSVLTMDYKEKRTLSYTLYPDGYDFDTKVDWTSSDTCIAAISSDGEVTAYHPGECKITAITDNGRMATCDVTVLEHEAYLVLWQRSNEIVTWPLASKPRIKYKDGEFWVISNDKEIGYLQQDVRKFTVEVGSVEDIANSIHTVDNPITLNCAIPGSIIYIYDISGRILESHKVASDGTLSYSLVDYPAGIYIVKSESTTIKIIKK